MHLFAFVALVSWVRGLIKMITLVSKGTMHLPIQYCSAVCGELYCAMALHRMCYNLSCMRHETREASKAFNECTTGTVCH